MAGGDGADPWELVELKAEPRILKDLGPQARRTAQAAFKESCVFTGYCCTAEHCPSYCRDDGLAIF